MEAAGLYGVAAEHGIAALTVATVSDQLKRQESPSRSRTASRGFDDMICLVLDAVTAEKRLDPGPIEGPSTEAWPLASSPPGGTHRCGSMRDRT